MAIAYVLINCDMGYEEQIIEELKHISDVKEIHGTFGAYDIFANEECLTRAQKLAIIEQIANQPRKKSERKLPHLNLNLLENELITN